MIAAIETTGETCGVALFESETLLVEMRTEIPRAHDRLLASLFRQALDSVDVRPGQVEVMAVSVGPGSFTGIRIGLSFAVGFALATGAAIVQVSTLDAIAWDARNIGRTGRRSRVLSTIPAGRLGVYAALYEIEPEFRRLTAPYTVPTDQLSTLLDENVFAAGPGITAVARDCRDCIALDTEHLSARAVGIVGREMYRKGLSVTPEQVMPIYGSEGYLAGR